MPASDLKQKILAAAAIAFAATGCAEAEEAPIQAAPASEELPAAEPAPPPEPEATPEPEAAEPQAAEPQAAEPTLDGEGSPAPEVEAEAPPAAERRRRSPRRATPSPTGGQAADSLEAMCGASCGASCSGVEDDEE